MNITNIKALTFDTGGTILDWHTGIKTSLQKTGKKYNLQRNWSEITNEIRKGFFDKMLNLGAYEKPMYNADDAHRLVLEELCNKYELQDFSENDKYEISWTAIHNLKAWDDFPPILNRLRKKYIVCSHTILSFRIIMDTAKKNDLKWDAIFSCEAIGKYKTLPDSYLTVANWLQLKPNQILKVACHEFDLKAAKNVGYNIAFVKRIDEWGKGSNFVEPKINCDIKVDKFSELAEILKV